MKSVFQQARSRIDAWSKNGRNIRRDRRRARKFDRALACRDASSATFIGITGSSAKTTTTAILSHIMEAHASVTSQFGFNTMATLSKTLGRPIHDRYVIAEVALDKPGTVREMADVLKPDIAIVTLIGLEHYSAFRTLEAVAAEKGALVSSVRPGGFAVLNVDDPHVAAMATRTRERIVSFGRSSGAQYRVGDIQAGLPERLRLSMEWNGGRLDLQTRFTAEHFWVPIAAAVAAALELGVPAELVAERVAICEPVDNRLDVVETSGGPRFLVDTAKSPWHSLPLAYKVLADAKAQRKRLVLGHISDFPGSNAKYRKAYLAGREIADEVIFVGNHAHRAKPSKQDEEEGRFFSFQTPREVADHIRRTAVAGELILLKSSSDLHLERIALAWRHDMKCWEPACSRRLTCQVCGLYNLPFELHRGRKGWRKRRLLKLVFKPWKMWTQRNLASVTLAL